METAWLLFPTGHYRQRTIASHPMQDPTKRILLLNLIADGYALRAFGAGEHSPFDGARFEAHRADVVAGVVARLAHLCPRRFKRHHHGPRIGHPGKALKQAHGAAKAAKEVPCKQELNG